MSRRCGNPHCFADEDEGCAMGEIPHTACSRWHGQVGSDATASSSDSQNTKVPWSGGALGLADLAHLTPRGRHLLIGVLGAHDAGKTTLLTACYLQLLRGQGIGELTFAGSRTLGAWESLAAHTRFDDPIKGPAFPPHTPRGIQRVPGLLHLALRNPQDEHRDVFLTDAPGEWFTRWAVKEDAPDAEGAHWTAQHADAFMVFADCQKLSGSFPVQARRDTQQLIERLSNHVGQRPVMLVWAKSDHMPASPIRNGIRTTLNRRITQAQEFDISTQRLDTLSHALGKIIEAAWNPPKARAINEPRISSQPFLAYRSRHE
jgi:hypothetical protein